MFEWYRKADWCTVYLADVVRTKALSGAGPGSLNESQWFKRGWTLQELVAPRHLSVWDTDWIRIGDGQMLQEQLALITVCFIQTISDADRMALAIGRKTSRTEDKAYSLLGLCDVNIPLLYGEGDRSFRRLQEAIIQRHYTAALFIHTGDSLLADSVDDFNMHNEAHYLERRQKAIQHGYVASYHLKPLSQGLSYLESDHPRIPYTWAKRVTNLGVEMQATYLNVTETTRSTIRLEFRLLIFQYATIEDDTVPTFVLVYNLNRSRVWSKMGLVNNEGYIDNSPGTLDALDRPIPPNRADIKNSINQYRSEMRQPMLKSAIVNHDLMIVT